MNEKENECPVCGQELKRDDNHKCPGPFHPDIDWQTIGAPEYSDPPAGDETEK